MIVDDDDGRFGTRLLLYLQVPDLIFQDKKEKEARPVLSSLLQHCRPHRTLSISRLSWREDVQILLVLMHCGAHKLIMMSEHFSRHAAKGSSCASRRFSSRSGRSPRRSNGQVNTSGCAVQRFSREADDLQAAADKIMSPKKTRVERSPTLVSGGWDGDGKDSRLFFFSFSMAQEWHRNLHDGPHAKGRVVPRRGRRGSGQTGKPGRMLNGR